MLRTADWLLDAEPVAVNLVFIRGWLNVSG